MIVIISSIIIFIICLIVYISSKGDAIAPIMFSGIGLACVIFMFVSAKYEHKTNYEKILTTKQTIQMLRENENISDMEKSGMIAQIIEINQYITKQRTWVDNPFIGSFYDKKIAKMNYLE